MSHMSATRNDFIRVSRSTQTHFFSRHDEYLLRCHWDVTERDQARGFLLFLNLSSLITHSEFQWSRSLSHRRPSRLVPRAFPRSPEAALLSRLTSTSARLLMTQEQGRWSLSRCVESLLWFLEDIKTDRAINSIRFYIHITREPRLANASHHVSSESNRRNILIAIWTFN